MFDWLRRWLFKDLDVRLTVIQMDIKYNMRKLSAIERNLSNLSYKINSLKRD